MQSDPPHPPDMPSAAPVATDPLGLAAIGVSELAARGPGDAPAVTGLAVAAMAALRPGAVLWVQEGLAAREAGRLSARGLQAMGADPGRLVLVRAERRLDALWTVEEGIRSGALAAVFAEIAEASFTQTRRLALATERHGVPAVLMLPHERTGASAARARWRVAARPSAPDPDDAEAPGRARWQAVLERARAEPAARGRTLELEFDDATLSLGLVSGLAARPAEPCPATGRRPGLRRAG